MHMREIKYEVNTVIRKQIATTNLSLKGNFDVAIKDYFAMASAVISYA